MPIESIIERKSLGVLMHPTCIPGGRVCGTFGRGAKEWIKKLHKHGIEYWQFLPLTPTDSTGSPYSSPSSFALNPWFLDIDDLIEKGFIFISNKKSAITPIFDPFIFIRLASIKVGNLFNVAKSEIAGSPLT